MPDLIKFQNNIVLSGGEDSRINAWSFPTDELYDKISVISSSRKRVENDDGKENNTIVSLV